MGIKNEIQAFKLKVKAFIYDTIYYIKRLFSEERITHFNGVVPLSKNLCVFCSFAPNGIQNSTWQYLEDLKLNGFSIHLLSTTKIKEEDLVKLKNICYKITEKENFGQDFGCYKISILEHYDKVDNILIANDSIIGPLFPLKEVFDEMASKECDFWGITDYIPLRNFIKKDCYHVASFFILFRSSVIKSQTFIDFWKNFKLTASRKKNVRYGELTLSKILLEKNFKVASFINSFKIQNLINQRGLESVFDELISETNDLSHFKKKRLNFQNKKDKEDFILSINKHKQNLMLIKYFKYPFIKKDIIQKNYIKQSSLKNFLDNNKFNISKENILKELKK